MRNRSFIAAVLAVVIVLALYSNARHMDTKSIDIREIGTGKKAASSDARTQARTHSGIRPVRTLPVGRMYSSAREQHETLTEATFDGAKARSYGEWYMHAREQLEACSLPSDGTREMYEARMILAYRPRMERPGLHRYVVETAEFVEALGEPATSSRQRECLATLNGSEFYIEMPSDITDNFYSFLVYDTFPAP